MESVIDEPDVVLNKAEFNEAFLAYDKRLMYGADVLSCLNKAQNNNQRYVYNNYYGTDTETIGAGERVEYFIDVVFTINSPLQEGLNLYYQRETGSIGQVAVGQATGPNYDDRLFDSTRGANNYFKIDPIYYYSFENGNVNRLSTTYANALWTGTRCYNESFKYNYTNCKW